MEELDLAMCKRFKEIRNELKIKQSDFSKALAISQGHASDIENGRKNVSDRIIEILNLKFNVNETWLRTGNGSKFVEVSRDEEISGFVGSVLKEEPDSFKRRFVSMLSRLDESDWEVLERMVDKMKRG